jgi:hypothetical protein
VTLLLLSVFGGGGENRTHVPTASDVRLYGWSNHYHPLMEHSNSPPGELN